MFSYNLRKKSDTKLVYSLSAGIRILSFVFALILVTGIISAASEEGFTLSLIIPSVFIAVLFLIPFYRDEWIFDNVKEEAVCVFGLGCFVKRQVLAYSEIDCVEIRHFYKGIREGSSARPTWRNREMSQLSIVALDEMTGRLSMETAPARKYGLKLERTANLIASFTGLRLSIDKAALETGFRRR